MKYKAKFIYLISPNKIDSYFYSNLKAVLKTKKIKFFQLRLKKSSEKEIINIAKKVKKICKRYKTKLIINDNPIIAKKVSAEGCHLGQSDMKIDDARRILKNKIIGITCHNSIKLVHNALNDGADYIAIGAFNSSKTKTVKYRAKLNDLRKIRKITNKPIVAIGGINQKNYKKLLLNNADFLAISGFIWKNKKLKPKEAIDKIK